jgi:hypothetical protein
MISLDNSLLLSMVNAEMRGHRIAVDRNVIPGSNEPGAQARLPHPLQEGKRCDHPESDGRILRGRGQKVGAEDPRFGLMGYRVPVLLRCSA